MSNKKLRALAVVLPQFHPIPENDTWWGKGFTEWTNVVKARPRFKTHYQPHLPADLGYYDMRLQKTLEDQAALAAEYNIFGFCYYHYWFNGKRLLETPVNKILDSPTPDFPFVLCWANENWSRRWDGMDKEVLIEQKYAADDHRKHAKYLCQNVFKDKRYIKIDGKPFFLFYNSHIIPDLKETIKIWREEVKANGFDDIYLAGIKTSEDNLIHPENLGFDAVIDWQPDWNNMQITPSFIARLLNKLNLGNTYRKIDYQDVVSKMIAKKINSFKHFEGVFPNWDNSARRKNNAFVVHDSTPEKYQNWLDEVCNRSVQYSEEENFVFINAWNEWAEGNHLEPDKKWGLGYLEKTKEILAKYL